nr:NADH dehydrogenase subunit 2 [Tettigometridae sp.]
MKTNLTNKTMILLIIASTMIMISSNNLLFSWISMEINTISFILILTKSKKSSDQPMKYFIIQSLSSSMMLISLFLNSLIETPFNFSIVMMVSMLMKLGMMPFHLWFPNMMKFSNWETCFMLMTIQKIAPCMIMCQMINMNLLLLPLSMSMLIAPVSAFNQTSMKKILAYSSINNSSWMVMSLMNSKMLFTFFMTIYSMLTMMTTTMMSTLNISYTNQIKSIKLTHKLNFSINMISLSGFPPTLGFLPKWMLMKSMVMKSIMLLSFMIASSIMSSFIYMKISSLTMTNLTMNKSYKKMKNYFIYQMMMNILTLPTFMIMKNLS